MELVALILGHGNDVRQGVAHVAQHIVAVAKLIIVALLDVLGEVAFGELLDNLDLVGQAARDIVRHDQGQDHRQDHSQNRKTGIDVDDLGITGLGA